MRSIGLTGGIASGKSTVTAMLAELGATIIDADRLGHRAYEPGTDTFDQVVAVLGDEIVGPDGAIDRAVLGGKVFGDAAAMTRLTDIVWPRDRRLRGAGDRGRGGGRRGGRRRGGGGPLRGRLGAARR